MAIVLGSFLVLVATQAFTAPALVELLDLRRRGALLDDEVVKVHLLLGLSIVAGALALLWLSRPVGLRLYALVIAPLLFAVFFSMATLRLDQVDFLAEQSRMAGGTGAVLLLAALAAQGNAWVRTGDSIALRFLWVGLALVLALAAADELFSLHERIGQRLDRLLTGPDGVPVARSIEGQDAITLVYAVGGVVAATVLGFFLRRIARRREGSYYGAFLAAAIVYLASVLLDNFPASGRELLATYDLYYAANSIEEVLELAAAGLLLSTCLAALLGANGGALAASLQVAAPTAGSGASRSLLGAAVVGSAACLIAFIHFASISETGAWSVAPAYAEVVTRRADSHLHPDGLATVAGVIYIANDNTSTVTAVRPGADARVLAGREHGLVRPDSLVVGPDGTVYVTDDGVGAVFGIAADGGVSTTKGPPGTFLEPKGIAVGSSNDLLLVDAGARKIFRLGPEGASVVADFTDYGKPEEIAIGKDGTIFVTQETPPRVYAVHQGGRIEMLRGASAGLVAPESIAVHDGRVYVADSGRGAVMRLERAGAIPALKLRVSLRHKVEGLAIDECGEVFVGFRAWRRSAVISLGTLGEASARPSVACAADREVEHDGALVGAARAPSGS